MNKKLKVAVLDYYIPNFQGYTSFLDIIYFSKFAKMKEFMVENNKQNITVGLLDSTWKNLEIGTGNFIISNDLKEIEKELLKIYNQNFIGQTSIPNKRLGVLKKFKGIAKPNIEISEEEWYLQ